MGAEFLTEAKDHGREIRAYLRDHNGHLIEVGQTVGATSVTHPHTCHRGRLVIASSN